MLSNVFICKDVDDVRIWKPSTSGIFSSKSYYKVCSGGMADCPSQAHVEVFCWLVVADQVSTVDNLRRTGLDADLCSLSGEERESIKH